MSKSWADVADEEDENQRLENDWETVPESKPTITSHPNCSVCNVVCENYTLSETNYSLFKPLCSRCSEMQNTEPTDTFMLKCSNNSCNSKSKLLMARVGQSSFRVMCLACFNERAKNGIAKQKRVVKQHPRQSIAKLPEPVPIVTSKFMGLDIDE